MQLRFDGKTVEDLALMRLKEYEPKDQPYFLAFSGGKDSIVIKDLAIRSGVKFEAVYNVTTVDPPELTRYIKKHHADVRRDIPDKSMFQLIVEKGFPLRQARWCCGELKEKGGIGRRVITGTRWAESPRRKAQRRIFEIWTGDNAKEMLNPIVDWTDADVWEYIKRRDLPYCELYDEGFSRLGCVGCPMNNHRASEIDKWPGIYRAYQKAFSALYDKRKASGPSGVDRWESAEDMFRWWVTGSKSRKEIEGQKRIEDDGCTQYQ